MNNFENSEKSGILYDFLDLPYVYKFFQFLLRKFNTNYRLFNEFIDIKEDSIVLDCGCGPGTYRNFLKTNQYIGIDINSNHIESAKKQFPRDKFINEDLLNIEKVILENIDSVIMIGILHHLSDEICLKLFENLYNKLSPNGEIYSLDPVYLEKQRFIAKFLASKDKGNFVRTPESYSSLFNNNFESRTEVINDLLRVPYDHYFMQLNKRP